MKLFFDLETIQTQRIDLIEDIASKVTAPKTMKKAETIEKWEKEQKHSAIKEAVSKTVFDGGYGEIISFGYAFDDKEPQVIQRDDKMAEHELLAYINVDVFGKMDYQPLWIGHNITGFDLRYLWKRFIVCGITPAFKIPYDSKPWSNDVYDTMFEWAGTGNDKKSMDFVCKALGVEGKGDMDGSKVYQAWVDAEYEKIGEYCKGDVEKTRMIYNRMNFV